ncbi:hypothetical protein FBD94_16670 [Pedobacter hiemivivus]|uniref:Uncharacterized protein n=1 Tax=Pedobacter hiemivivus TaxID=2530454 RepID=A0A4U1G651_9SPHI|nr:hypothetical protein [Pedobacter hiemivivus]TKC59165.1 hypothetical protein FBD94_16670 [Pedobacter hiemivivus]
MSRRKKGYFELFNEVLKKYQYAINFLAILIGFTGLIFTFSQIISSNIALKQSIYTFNGEQYPILSFKLHDKDNALFKVNNVIPEDMLFQFAKVHWHPLLKNVVNNPSIRIHDKTWYLTPMSTYLSYKCNLDSLFNKYNKSDYLTLEMPVALGINYVKYGESRLIYAIYSIEFYVQKNINDSFQKYKVEPQGIYLLRYLKPETDINKALFESELFSVQNR